jgi:predicted enzyme related to lactoylglutathione lyase
MSQPVVHFEIIGAEPAKLREYYAGLFGWEFQVGDGPGGQPRRRRRSGGAAMKYLVMIYGNPQADELWQEITQSGELVAGEALADPTLTKARARS